MKFRNMLLGALMVYSGSGFAASWVFDEAHSAADFSIRHMMVTNVKGTVTGIKGAVEIDDKDLTKSKVDVTLNVSSLDTRNQKRDEHLRSPDFFDAQKFPEMKFVSKKVQKDGKNLKVTGDLTIKGITKSVTMLVDGPSPAVKDPWGKTKRGLSATTTLSRKDFGITWNKNLDGGGVVLGDDVKVSIEAELEPKA